MFAQTPWRSIGLPPPWDTMVAIVVYSALVVVTVWVISRFVWSGCGRRPDDAEQLLRRRYAAGEIDDDEFRRRLDVLKRADR